jgi:hypothetical protein
MLDIYGDVEDFGSGWNYAKFEDRVGLMVIFLNKIINEDIEEMKKFLFKYDLNNYREIWIKKCVISLDILEGLRGTLLKIFDSMTREEKDTAVKSRIDVFRGKTLRQLADMEIYAKDRMEKIFN